jgi:hypothetical protein
MFKDKKKLASLILVVVLAGWAANLNNKLTHEIEVSEALRVQLTKATTRVITKTVIKRVPVFTRSGDLALDGHGNAVFTDEAVTNIDNATETETSVRESVRVEKETIETRSLDREFMVAWDGGAAVGLLYTQRLIGPITLGVFGTVDVLTFSPRGYVLAGVRF